MTTRSQRERLISLHDIEARIDDVFVAETWYRAFPKEPLPADFPPHMRSSVRAFAEQALVPSNGEMGIALKKLHDRLIVAIHFSDRERAATAIEQTPKAVLDELRRRSPSPLPAPQDIRDCLRGIDLAKEMLGCCISGAMIVPGRRRPDGRRSRPTLRILPRYRQRRGHPRHEAERTLVRSLGEYFYNRQGNFPGLKSHGGSFDPDAGPFARVVADILARCGVSSVNEIKLIQRCLCELPGRNSLSPNNGQ